MLPLLILILIYKTMAKEKEKPVQQELSESTKKVYAALTEKGYKNERRL